ncbi:hypothetical protein AWB69_03761 [Caballeronia udeis]|uniref:Uncharacterized protein n=1 Tax=Caballeronia udeis TaxID=1232866 RepID=A0A158H2L1_9BURK|nr:hypothetical protein AWB69_03761 [Caballeronia udeis]
MTVVRADLPQSPECHVIVNAGYYDLGALKTLNY